MKTILENRGNRRWFRLCSARKGNGFTVNVWINKGPLPSYDAGFYVGTEKQRKKANFRDDGYKRGVGYRIRVKPKFKICEELRWLLAD